MCGIFGLIGKNLNTDISKSVAAIKHRGPDDTGFYGDASVLLGFNRLSIIDLSSKGHQPMSNEDGTVWIVFNGEIYNYADLKKELVMSHTFKSDTDTEILIHGFEQWGLAGLLKRINGMFAFCIYDRKNKTSYLIRDRIGKKPLYYYKTQSYVAFASEAKAFFKLPEFKFNIDSGAFTLFMGFPYLPDNNATLIKEVHKVPPGSYLEISAGAIKKPVVYWQLPAEKSELAFETAKEKMEELLIDAVTKRLIADVPVGILLSGGLDSSLITALAGKYSNKQITTINISFKDSCIDEREYARLVAKHCNTNHTEVHLNVSNVYREFKKSIWIYDDLSTTDGGLFSEYLLAKKVRDAGIKVALVGEGADEVFGGYTWFQFAQIPFKLLPECVTTAGFYYAIMRELSGKRFLKYAGKLQNRLNEYAKDTFGKIQSYEIKYSLPNHYCMKVDKGTSAASIEARCPYLDYRVVELAASLDFKTFLKNDVYNSVAANEKYILREIARKYLPQEIVEKKKKGGMLPTNDILRVGIKEDAELIFKNAYLIEFFGKDYLQQLINSTPTFKPFVWQKEWILWKCLIFALWYDFYTNYAKN